MENLTRLQTSAQVVSSASKPKRVNMSWIRPLLLAAVFCGALIHLGYAEQVTLHLNPRLETVPLEEARMRVWGVKRGCTLAALVDTMGYPDEVRLLPEGESDWCGWCYGVSSAGALPRVGMVLISTNQLVTSVSLPTEFDVFQGITNSSQCGTDGPGRQLGIRCRIAGVVLTNDTPYPAIAYIASVVVSNGGPKSVDIRSQYRILTQLLHVEVTNHRGILIFARRPGNAFGMGDHFSIAAGSCMSGDIPIFVRDVDLGIPEPGEYELRVGLVLSQHSMVWSEKVPFKVVADRLPYWRR